ncbi:hypothetical protein ALC62_04607 [Cyphomyrmex costatus]|uniref:Uncharacterized protein n=1 Tax=Cyphomyrmex costatus TaxID=456900 RepID=A0A195CVF6_9HYME|nr:hypothetical protein ALC62_04607 [Cyphomyrmex costatus]
MLYDFQFTKYNGLFVPRFVKPNKTKLPHAGNTLSRCWFNANVLTGGLRSEKERRSREYGSEASNWRMEIIQELIKPAAWEEKTFYGPCVNFDMADAL